MIVIWGKLLGAQATLTLRDGAGGAKATYQRTWVLSAKYTENFYLALGELTRPFSRAAGLFRNYDRAVRRDADS